MVDFGTHRLGDINTTRRRQST